MKKPEIGKIRPRKTGKTGKNREKTGRGEGKKIIGEIWVGIGKRKKKGKFGIEGKKGEIGKIRGDLGESEKKK